MSFRCFAAILLCICINVVSIDKSCAQFDEMTNWVPDSANTIVLVRAKEIFNSAKSKKEKWTSQRLKAYRSGTSFIPPTVDRFVLAAQLDYEYMEPIWQTALFETKKDKPVNIVEVSKRIKGNLESISGYDALVLPNDAYAVKINEYMLGAMVPANRQVTSRWLRNGRGVSNLSRYLKEAVQFADQNAHIIVAFDFQDAINPEALHEKVVGSGLCEKDEVESFCMALSKMKGATLGITIKEKISGAIKVDFDGSPEVLRSSAKAILINALSENGLMIDDMNNWTAKMGRDHIRLSGPMTQSGLRQVGRLIEHPIVNTFVSGDEYVEAEVDMKTRTKQYFDSVQQVGEELKRKEAKALKTYAKWFNKYAREIDSLPLVNVDPIMLDYGRYVSDSFRDVSTVLDETNLQKVTRRGSFEDSYGTYTDDWGYRTTYFESNIRNRQKVTAQANVTGGNKAREIIRQVDEATAQVRRDMSEKYKVDF